VRYYISYKQSQAVELPIPPDQLRAVRRIARRTGVAEERVVMEALVLGLRGAEAALRERGRAGARQFLKGSDGSGDGKGVKR
jgi:hypothetical protein